MNIPQPNALRGTAELVINGDLRRQLEQDEIDIERVKQLLDAASTASITLDRTTLEFTYRKTLERIAAAFAEEPQLARLDHLNRAADALALLPFTVNLWKVQKFKDANFKPLQ